MNNILHPTLLLLALSILSFSQNCGPIDTSHQIQAGTYTLFQNDFSLQPIKTFQLFLRLFDRLSTPQIAITTENIFNLNSEAGISYYIKGQTTTISSNPILLIYVSSQYSFSWSSLKISYMVSQNDELILGSKNLLPTKNHITQNTYSAQFQIPKFRLFPFTQYRATIFISGFKTPNSNYQISILSSNVDQAKSLVFLEIDIGNTYFEVLSLSYIVYDQSHDLFSFYNDGVGTYQIAGPISMRGSLLSNTKLVICSKKFSSFCSSGKIIINGDCFCPKNQISVNSECVCDSGYVRNNDNICTFQTQKCPQNQIYNSLLLACECKQGYERVFSQCVENTPTPDCGANEQFNSIYEICQCVAGYIKSAGSCIKIECPKGTTFDSQKQSCESLCLPNFTFNSETQICQCLNGYYLKSSECFPIPSCPTASLFNPSTQICQCTKKNEYLINARCQSCRSNEQFNGRECVCRQGTNFINGSCLVCPPNSSFSNNRCACNSGFKFNSDGTACLQEAKCLKNQILNSNGKCQCMQGFYLKNGECLQIPSCPKDQLFNLVSQSCECSSGTHLINGVCQTCGTNEKWNGSACECVDGTFFINNQCSSCPPNKVYSSNSKQCFCKTQFVQIKQQCKLCPSGSSINADRSTCICQGTQIFNIKNFACESCPSNSSPDNQNINCICNQGYLLNTSTSICEPRPTVSSPSAGGIQIIFSSEFQVNGRIITFFKLSDEPSCLQALLNSAQGSVNFLTVKVRQIKPAYSILYALEYDPFTKEFIVDLYPSTKMEIGTNIVFSLEFNGEYIKTNDSKCFSQLDSNSKIVRTKTFETTATFRR